MKTQGSTKGSCLVLLAFATLSAGCQHVNIAQITYEVLRAEDCRRNQLEDFCSRTYASEYYDYVRLRENFLHDQIQSKQNSRSNELTFQQAHNTL